MMDGHLSDRLLAEYAAGTTSEGVSLAVAAHLTYCPECRARLAAIETVSGAMLAEAEPADAPDFAALEALLDDEPAPEAPVFASTGPLPAPVREAIGMEFDEIPWKFRLPGVHVFDFAQKDGEELSLLKVGPGVAIPRHTHEADELTVVLEGALEDQGRNYRVGEIAIAGPNIDHRPRAAQEGPCICLAVLTGGLRFTGPFGRALNLFN